MLAAVAAGIIVVFIGGLCLGLPIYELYYRKKSRASLSWPQVTGTISRTGVVGRVGVFTGSSIQAQVIYHYEVNGVPHVGERIGFNDVFYRSKEEARAALEPYPVNSTVTVYFDPAHPEKAILSREYRSVARGIVIIYVCVALIAVCLVVLHRLGPGPTARTQPQVEPFVPPPRVTEPPERSGPAVVPKSQPKAEPTVVAKAGTQVIPKIEPKSEPQGDRAVSFELYAALRSKKPLPAIEALLNRNPAINGASSFNVPLVAAAEGCEPEAARLLLAKGADPNAPYVKGMTPKMNQPTALMTAAANGCASIAQILLESGANPNATTAEPALVIAVEHKSEPIARLLLDHGADPNFDGHFGPSPVGAAAFDANDAMAALLLARGANPNAPATGGVTPLMLAAEKDGSSVLRLLLDNRADPKAVDGKGRTVLMHAISKDNADAVDQLLARGVSVNARDQKGTTALGYTKERPNSPQMRRIIAALRNAGASE